LSLGLEPHYMTSEMLQEMLQIVIKHKQRINQDKILPLVMWSGN
jgi:UDP-sulfoquinovose synthase